MIIFSFSGFILGTILGSLLKVLADRGLTKKTFLGRSCCPKCQSKLSWYDLIPIFSYFLLKGKCRSCHKKISAEYLIVEIITGVLIGYLFFQTYPILIPLISNFPSSSLLVPVSPLREASSLQFLIILFNLFIQTFFITILLTLFLTDLKKMLIPDRIIVPATLISVFAFLCLTILKIGYIYIALSNDVIGKYMLLHSNYFQSQAFSITLNLFTQITAGVILAGFFLLLIIITRGKGMGGGDVKLGLFMGINLGISNTLVAVMTSFLSGAVFSIILIILKKRGFGQVIPFGPFLVVGSLIALFWGSKIMEWYLHLTGL